MPKKKSTKRKPSSKTEDQVPFEQAFEQLKQVVAELEDGNLTLSDSLQKYQEGIANLRQCHVSLESAKKRIEVLVDLDTDGNLVTQPFDDSSSANSSGNVRRSTNMPNTEFSGRNDATSEIDDFEPDDEVDDDSPSLF